MPHAEYGISKQPLWGQALFRFVSAPTSSQIALFKEIVDMEEHLAADS
jgi:hypothetical protein